MSNFLPSDLLDKLASLLSPEELSAFVQSHETGGQVTSIRTNPSKMDGTRLAYEPVPWCDTGYYLPQRPSFTLDPAFHAGAYYVQEASSMCIAHVIQHLGLDKKDLTALDLCAAPGGKSTLLNSYLSPKSLLVSNEIIKTRVGTLAGNLTKWGKANVVVSNNDPSAFSRLPAFFDLLVVDAPCSGSGLFRKDSDAVTEWSDAAVQLCSMRQRRILADSLPTLAEGGVLLYSTCSYSTEENEDICDWLINEYDLESIPVPIPPTWQIVQSQSKKHHATGFRFYPHKVLGEGFFIAAFRKTSPEKPISARKGKAIKPQFDRAQLSEWIDQTEKYHIFTLGEELIFILAEHEQQLQLLQQQLYLKKAGTRIGKPMKKELIPNHELALSIALHPSVPRLELELESALDYLRKKEIKAGPAHLGWLAASFQGLPLGWAKALGNRMNNYYPKDWRIINL